MEYKLYALRNRLSRLYESIYPYTTDEMASKYLTLLLTQDSNRRVDLDEYEIMLIGKYDIVNGVITPLDHCIVPFDSRATTSLPNSNPSVDDRNIFVEKQ